MGYENNNSQYDCWVHGGQGESAFCRRLPGCETDCLTDLLLEHLEERAAAKPPFFAVLSVQPPHDPYLAPPEYMARFNPQTLRMRENVPHIPALEERARREYAGACAMVENMDWNMGRIRNKLWETGLAENTHILFFSDHGDMHGSHGLFLKTHPYEESLRIPFVIGGAPPPTGTAQKSPRREDVPERTLFVITTDGLENASRRYDYAAVRRMIERQKERYGWEFLFLGANIDAAREAARFGIRPDRAVNYRCDRAGTALNYEVIGDAVCSVRACEPLTADWKRRIEADRRERG